MTNFKFKKTFRRNILKGVKTQTIRRDVRCKPGDKITLELDDNRRDFEGVCESVYPVMFQKDEVWSLVIGKDTVVTLIQNRDELKRFAYAEGFDSWPQCRDFFKKQYGLPFSGFVHSWDFLTLKTKENHHA